MSRSRLLIHFALLLTLPAHAVYTQETWNPFDPAPVKGFGNHTLTPNFGIEGEMLLHLSAVDLRQEAGTPVYAVRKGTPSFPDKSAELSEWTTTVQVLSDDGILTYFMHLAPDSIPATLKADMEKKRPIEKGTLLGVLYKHKHLQSHVHFGAADCKKHLRINPQPFVDYTDPIAPTVTAIVVHRSDKWQDLGDKVSGDVDLTVYAHDAIASDTERFALHRLELEIASGEKKVFATTVFDASTMPARASAKDETCEDFGDYDGYDTDLGEAIYRRRGFRKKARAQWTGLPYKLTGTASGVPAELRNWFRPHDGPWKTAALPNGRYTLKVRALDAKGNHTEFRRTITLEN